MSLSSTLTHRRTGFISIGGVVVYIARKYLGAFLDFSFGGVTPPPRIQRIKIEMILRYKYTVKKAKKNLKLRVGRLQAMTGIICMNRFSREKHYSLINCIILYFLLIFSSDRCIHSEEIGAYSFSYQDQ